MGYHPTMPLCIHFIALVLWAASLDIVPLAYGQTTITYGVVLSSTDPSIGSFTNALNLAVADVNANPTLLSNATLSLRFYDSKASPRVVVAEGLRAIAEGVNAIVGEADSGITEPLVLATETKLIPVCSGASTSPSLSNKSEFATFFRTLPSDNAQGAAMVSLMWKMGWMRAGIISEATSYGQGVGDALLAAIREQNAGISIDTRLSYVPGDQIQVSNQLQSLKESGVRIIVAIGADFTRFVNVMKEADNLGLIGDDYVWILSDAFFPVFTEVKSNDKRLFKGALAVYPQEGAGPKYTQYRNAGNRENPYDLFYYDCVLALAAAHTKMLSEGVSLANLAANTVPPFNITQFTRVNFTGMTGTVVFDKDGDRDGDYALHSFDGNTATQVAVIRRGKTFDPPQPVIKFHSGSTVVPLDTPSFKLNVVEWTSPMGIAISAIFGVMIIVCIVSIVLSLTFRKSSILKPVSPVFCGIISFGLALVFGSELADVGWKSTFTCNLYPWLLGIGFATALASVFVKQWRIFRIFENVQMAKRPIRDGRLLYIFSGIVSVQVILLGIMTAASPLRPIRIIDRKTETTSFVCTATNTDIQNGLTYIIYAYCGILLIVCTYLAIRTRNVYSAFNESKWIGLSVYNIILCGLAALAVTYIGGNTMSEPTRFAVRNAAVFFAATVAYISLVGRLLAVLIAKETGYASDIISSEDGSIGLRSMPSIFPSLNSGTPRSANASLMTAQIRQASFPMKHVGKMGAVWKQQTMTLALGSEKVLSLIETNAENTVGLLIRLKDVKARLLVPEDPDPHDLRHCRFEIRWGNVMMKVQGATIAECEEWVYLINSGGLSSGASQSPARGVRDRDVTTARTSGLQVDQIKSG
ncbi:uncharacterized protein SPPG_06409 [Spizellomyces punctatus DAOM BR117]|uniref:G-protein coupled receptors family 3 profile domain-containing protein n=1 Tax=Spizellomyces punctatus (strain DAOM BR117) TaxID=645134 RepID=A0A0L0HCN7_SPIPD|nr:uncharacterized protein SPPG_06409 [Spizellomyces punctatus DAOM BR117]KNC98731.1 hypothetical protein SPPG_06409 [Spizellomyces punctatus DAOM BR117]|eukprot:XP_016606771.1 hypothetical protein SPPG_06409 [Spizellomyces punctatus DAOM BR117]